MWSKHNDATSTLYLSLPYILWSTNKDQGYTSVDSISLPNTCQALPRVQFSPWYPPMGAKGCCASTSSQESFCFRYLRQKIHSFLQFGFKEETCWSCTVSFCVMTKDTSSWSIPRHQVNVFHWYCTVSQYPGMKPWFLWWFLPHWLDPPWSFVPQNNYPAPPHTLFHWMTEFSLSEKMSHQLKCECPKFLQWEWHVFSLTHLCKHKDVLQTCATGETQGHFDEVVAERFLVKRALCLAGAIDSYPIQHNI